MWIKIALLGFMVASCANGGWTKSDTQRQAVLTGLMAVDCAQTLKIAREPDKYHELNPMLFSSHPSEERVLQYFATAYAIKTGVSMALPPEYRKWWQYAMIGASAGAVGWNMSIGLGVGF